jgi:hypothetical protein
MKTARAFSPCGPRRLCGANQPRFADPGAGTKSRGVQSKPVSNSVKSITTAVPSMISPPIMSAPSGVAYRREIIISSFFASYMRTLCTVVLVISKERLRNAWPLRGATRRQAWLGGGNSRARTEDPPTSHRTGLRFSRERKFSLRRHGPKSGSPLGRDQYGDYEKRAKARRTRRYCEGTQPSSSPGDWVVETVGLELRTHHPVIEPVSVSAGNGNFRCRDRGSKSASPLGRDRYGDYEKQAKARISGE